MPHSNIAPAAMEKFQSAGGLNIAFRNWRPATPPRAVVVLVHGFNSHSGQYAWAGGQLAANGYAVYAPDLRGRGLSDGERYYVESFSEYLADVDGMMKVARSREPGLPVFLFGHSAGGVVACVYTLEHQKEIAGLICESFAHQVPAPDFVLAALKGISRIAPHARVLRLKNEDFSRDPVTVRALNSDPLIENEVQPTRTVAELARADDRLKREFPRITLPVLILHGTADKATRPSGSQFFFETAGSADKTLKLYEGHFHDLLADVGKEDVMSEITRWLDSHVVVSKAA